jgi:hypothetical protein
MEDSEMSAYMISGDSNSRMVAIDGVELSPEQSQAVFNHSPDGFCWGYAGSGPSQLALALLLIFADEDFAKANYQAFKFEVIANLKGDFLLPVANVLEWIEARNGKPLLWCSGCGHYLPDVEERWSFGVYAGKLCRRCCLGFKDHCGIDQPQGDPSELTEPIEEPE